LRILQLLCGFDAENTLNSLRLLPLLLILQVIPCFSGDEVAYFSIFPRKYRQITKKTQTFKPDFDIRRLGHDIRKTDLDKNRPDHGIRRTGLGMSRQIAI